MGKSGVSNVRNIGFIAHIDAGKTTLTERILFFTGKIHKVGEVHDGQATMDWMEEEQRRGITITSAVTYVPWRGHEIHIIDTPGHVDFTIEVERSLRVLDGAVMILCAVGGVEPQTETVALQAKRNNIPLLAFVNKLDRLGADFDAAVDQVKSKLAVRPLSLQRPIYEDGQLVGLFDLVDCRQILWSDADGQSYKARELDAADERIKVYRDQLLENISEFSDDLLEKYLAGVEPDPAEVKAVIRQATVDRKIVPVFCGSALKNRGVQPVLDAIVDYLPSPLDRSRPVEVESADNLLAYVFKVQMDDGRRMVYLRLYAGELHVGDEIYNVSRDLKERVSRLFQMHAHDRVRIDKAVAGDIVAVFGLKQSVTGDTIAVEGCKTELEQIEVNEPVIALAIEPLNSEAAKKLELATPKLMEEDPTIRISEDSDTGQIILEGMGELHLEIAASRLRDDYGVGITVGKPQVLYRSTVKNNASGEIKFEKIIGETDHYGYVQLRVSSGSSGEGNIFTVKPQLGSELMRSVNDGLVEGCLADPIHGYEVVDLRVEVERVDVSERATLQGTKIAAQMAVHAAMRQAGIDVLEPIMQLDIAVPDESVGDVVNDLGARGASIEGVEMKGGFRAIKAYVPLSKTFGYSTALRSIARGRASMNMRFFGFDRV